MDQFLFVSDPDRRGGVLLLFSAPAGCQGGANDFGIVIRSNVGAGGELHRCAYSIVGESFYSFIRSEIIRSETTAFQDISMTFPLNI